MNKSYLQQVVPLLPDELLMSLRTLSSSSPNAEAFLEEFLRFVAGAEPSSTASEQLRQQWQAKQTTARGTLTSILSPSHSQTNGQKRSLDDANSGTQDAKRQRTSPPAPSADDAPVFTLHSVSATSPVRKKVDITIGKSTISFKHASSGNLEATIPLSSLRRAFLLPTRGKSKPHWTVVLLSGDTSEKDKSCTTNAQDSQQIIFGLDATTTAPLTTSAYTSGAEPTKSTIAKGNPSLPVIRDFLSRLPDVAVHEPSSDVFKSAVPGIGSNASTTGIPSVEAYRAAKQGNLWFMKEGILWGENKPCEFWSVEDLINSAEGLRISPGSGRVFSLTLTRKVEVDEPKTNKATEGENAQDTGPRGIETELGMIDSREREVIAGWVRKHQHLFGRKAGAAPLTSEEIKQQKEKLPKYTGPVTIHQLVAESDSEDEDFTVDSDDNDDGSAASDSGLEDEGSGTGSNDEDDAEGTDDEDGDIEEGEDRPLDPAHHPLMRPGVMPKMSRAVMDMVVNMVEDQVMGGGQEEDELEDD